MTTTPTIHLESQAAKRKIDVVMQDQEVRNIGLVIVDHRPHRATRVVHEGVGNQHEGGVCTDPDAGLETGNTRRGAAELAV